ncbi:MAG: hypothetical protein KKD92_06770, partial [Proteobacteria bacterium]|nr:hypothetical protein [Pseudomonadota bacterium]
MIQILTHLRGNQTANRENKRHTDVSEETGLHDSNRGCYMIAYRTILTVCFALFLSSCAATPILTGKGDMSREIKQKAPVVFEVDISPDGRYVLSGSMDSFILWDLLQGKKIQTFTHE